MSLLPVTALPRQLLPKLFQTNNVPLSTLQSDPRVTYAAFIPDQHYPQSPSDPFKLPLLVLIHGTSRTYNRHISAWHDFAIENRVAVVAPLFPCLVSSPIDIDGYHYLGRPPLLNSPLYEKTLEARVEVQTKYAKVDNSDVRYDLLLLALLDEITIRWPGIETAKILLNGFSGGGQFAHRFMYLHPERLLAVGVGSPGGVTALNFSQLWPAGVKDVGEIFGQHVDVEKLKQLPIMASVGADDTGEGASMLRGLGLSNAPGDRGKTNQTRVEKLTELVQQWRSTGLSVEFEIVPDAKHEMEKVNVAVVPFMARHVRRYWEGQAAALNK
jgi:poly(3-hydroxybutyrate) depolymerase